MKRLTAYPGAIVFPLLAALFVLDGCPAPVDTTPPADAPGILKPMQGMNTGADKRPVFSWTSVADGDTYELQADDSPGFDSVDYHWTGLTGTSYRPSADMAASASAPVGTRYYLRVRAVDAAGNAGPWGGTEPQRYVNVGRFDGDFNGDGFSDVIVGSDRYDEFRGKAYVYFGGPSMDNVEDRTMTGESWADRFGISVASAGDVDGDGFADAIVGAPGCDSNRGRAYLYRGGSPMDSTADVVFSGETTGTSFGYSVHCAGDVNGDGRDDLIVGAYSYNDMQGRAYLYFGGSPMDTIADVTLTGETGGRAFGICVSSAGDMNGDGYLDVLVGASQYNSNQGRAYLYCGGKPMNPVADLTITGEATGDSYGGSVSSAGDVDGDGYADAVVGAGGCSGSRGRVYVYRGGSSLDANVDLTMVGGAMGDTFGRCVSSAGDVNGDGCADVIVGAFGYNSIQGRAYLYCGSAYMDDGIDVTMTGEAAGEEFGVSVAEAGEPAACVGAAS